MRSEEGVAPEADSMESVDGAGARFEAPSFPAPLEEASIVFLSQDFKGSVAKQRK